MSTPLSIDTNNTTTIKRANGSLFLLLQAKTRELNEHRRREAQIRALQQQYELQLAEFQSFYTSLGDLLTTSAAMLPSLPSMESLQPFLSRSALESLLDMSSNGQRYNNGGDYSSDEDGDHSDYSDNDLSDDESNHRNRLNCNPYSTAQVYLRYLGAPTIPKHSYNDSNNTNTNHGDDDHDHDNDNDDDSDSDDDYSEEFFSNEEKLHQQDACLQADFLSFKNISKQVKKELKTQRLKFSQSFSTLTQAVIQQSIISTALLSGNADLITSIILKGGANNSNSRHRRQQQQQQRQQQHQQQHQQQSEISIEVVPNNDTNFDQNCDNFEQNHTNNDINNDDNNGNKNNDNDDSMTNDEQLDESPFFSPPDHTHHVEYPQIDSDNDNEDHLDNLDNLDNLDDELFPDIVDLDNQNMINTANIIDGITLLPQVEQLRRLTIDQQKVITNQKQQMRDINNALLHYKALSTKLQHKIRVQNDKINEYEKIADRHRFNQKELFTAKSSPSNNEHLDDFYRFQLLAERGELTANMTTTAATNQIGNSSTTAATTAATTTPTPTTISPTSNKLAISTSQVECTEQLTNLIVELSTVKTELIDSQSQNVALQKQNDLLLKQTQLLQSQQVHLFHGHLALMSTELATVTKLYQPSQDVNELPEMLSNNIIIQNTEKTNTVLESDSIIPTMNKISDLVDKNILAQLAQQLGIKLTPFKQVNEAFALFLSTLSQSVSDLSPSSSPSSSPSTPSSTQQQYSFSTYTPFPTMQLITIMLILNSSLSQMSQQCQQESMSRQTLSNQLKFARSTQTEMEKSFEQSLRAIVLKAKTIEHQRNIDFEQILLEKHSLSFQVQQLSDELYHLRDQLLHDPTIVSDMIVHKHTQRIKDLEQRLLTQELINTELLVHASSTNISTQKKTRSIAFVRFLYQMLIQVRIDSELKIKAMEEKLIRQTGVINSKGWIEQAQQVKALVNINDNHSMLYYDHCCEDRIYPKMYKRSDGSIVKSSNGALIVPEFEQDYDNGGNFYYPHEEDQVEDGGEEEDSEEEYGGDGDGGDGDDYGQRYYGNNNNNNNNRSQLQPHSSHPSSSSHHYHSHRSQQQQQQQQSQELPPIDYHYQHVPSHSQDRSYDLYYDENRPLDEEEEEDHHDGDHYNHHHRHPHHHHHHHHHHDGQPRPDDEYSYEHGQELDQYYDEYGHEQYSSKKPLYDQYSSKSSSLLSSSRRYGSNSSSSSSNTRSPSRYSTVPYDSNGYPFQSTTVSNTSAPYHPSASTAPTHSRPPHRSGQTQLPPSSLRRSGQPSSTSSSTSRHNNPSVPVDYTNEHTYEDLESTRSAKPRRESTRSGKPSRFGSDVVTLGPLGGPLPPPPTLPHNNPNPYQNGPPSQSGNNPYGGPNYPPNNGPGPNINPNINPNHNYNNSNNPNHNPYAQNNPPGGNNPNSGPNINIYNPHNNNPGQFNNNPNINPNMNRPPPNFHNNGPPGGQGGPPGQFSRPPQQSGPNGPPVPSQPYGNNNYPPQQQQQQRPPQNYPPQGPPGPQQQQQQQQQQPPQYSGYNPNAPPGGGPNPNNNSNNINPHINPNPTYSGPSGNNNPNLINNPQGINPNNLNNPNNPNNPNVNYGQNNNNYNFGSPTGPSSGPNPNSINNNNNNNPNSMNIQNVPFNNNNNNNANSGPNNNYGNNINNMNNNNMNNMNNNPNCPPSIMNQPNLNNPNNPNPNTFSNNGPNPTMNGPNNNPNNLTSPLPRTNSSIVNNNPSNNNNNTDPTADSYHPCLPPLQIIKDVPPQPYVYTHHASRFTPITNYEQHPLQSGNNLLPLNRLSCNADHVLPTVGIVDSSVWGHPASFHNRIVEHHDEFGYGCGADKNTDYYHDYSDDDDNDSFGDHNDDDDNDNDDDSIYQLPFPVHHNRVPLEAYQQLQDSHLGIWLRCAYMFQYIKQLQAICSEQQLGTPMFIPPTHPQTRQFILSQQKKAKFVVKNRHNSIQDHTDVEIQLQDSINEGEQIDQIGHHVHNTASHNFNDDICYDQCHDDEKHDDNDHNNNKVNDGDHVMGDMTVQNDNDHNDDDDGDGDGDDDIDNNNNDSYRSPIIDYSPELLNYNLHTLYDWHYDMNNITQFEIYGVDCQFGNEFSSLPQSEQILKLTSKLRQVELELNTANDIIAEIQPSFELSKQFEIPSYIKEMDSEYSTIEQYQQYTAQLETKISTLLNYIENFKHVHTYSLTSVVAPPPSADTLLQQHQALEKSVLEAGKSTQDEKLPDEQSNVDDDKSTNDVNIEGSVLSTTIPILSKTETNTMGDVVGTIPAGGITSSSAASILPPTLGAPQLSKSVSSSGIQLDEQLNLPSSSSLSTATTVTAPVGDSTGTIITPTPTLPGITTTTTATTATNPPASTTPSSDSKPTTATTATTTATTTTTTKTPAIPTQTIYTNNIPLYNYIPLIHHPTPNFFVRSTFALQDVCRVLTKRVTQLTHQLDLVKQTTLTSNAQISHHQAQSLAVKAEMEKLLQLIDLLVLEQQQQQHHIPHQDDESILSHNDIIINHPNGNSDPLAYLPFNNFVKPAVGSAQTQPSMVTSLSPKHYAHYLQLQTRIFNTLHQLYIKYPMFNAQRLHSLSSSKSIPQHQQLAPKQSIMATAMMKYVSSHSPSIDSNSFNKNIKNKMIKFFSQLDDFAAKLRRHEAQNGSLTRNLSRSKDEYNRLFAQNEQLQKQLLTVQKPPQQSQRELDELRTKILCSICSTREKSAVIDGCGHTLCMPCMEDSLRARNRKCPLCASTISASHVHSMRL